MNTKRMRLFWGLVFGIAFGFLLQKGGATKYDVSLSISYCLPISPY